MNVHESFCRSIKVSVEHIVYVFEDYRLDTGRRQLYSSGGVVVALNSRAMEALVMLVSHAGDLVTKRQLLEGVWPGAVVEDNNINQCVLAIRKALGETAGTNRFIMTVPGRGYRFVAPVITQKRETLEDAMEPPAGVSSHWIPARRTLAIAGILITLWLGVFGLYLRHGIGRLPVPGEAPDMIVQLHRPDAGAVTPGASLLIDCLRQRPDLHLQIEVHVVGSPTAPPVWTGQFIAGADDLLPEDARRSGARNACQSLTAPP